MSQIHWSPSYFEWIVERALNTNMRTWMLKVDGWNIMINQCLSSMKVVLEETAFTMNLDYFNVNDEGNILEWNENRKIAKQYS